MGRRSLPSLGARDDRVVASEGVSDPRGCARVVLKHGPVRPDARDSVDVSTGVRATAITSTMMRAGRDAVQGSPLRSDRVRRTRLARVYCT